MADISLVIKIPEEIKRALDNNEEYRLYTESVCNVMLTAIKYGTSLPKGHGDLKDVDNLKHAFATWSMAVQGNFSDVDIASIIYNSPTIIEADKEGKDADSN